MTLSPEADDESEIDYEGDEEVVQYRNASITDQLEDVYLDESVARQAFNLLREQVAPPELEIPYREYSQKNDAEEDKDNPNIPLHSYRLSKRAYGAWKGFLGSLSSEQIIRLLLTDEEFSQYEEYKKIVKEEDDEFQQELEAKYVRACTETIGFTRCHVPDRLEYDPYNITFDEWSYRANLTDYQTNIWRKPYVSMDSDGDFGFMDPKKDPDFLNPLSVSKKWLIKPLSRPYNLTFDVQYKNTEGKIFSKISYPKSNKDYSTEEDIIYYIKSNGYIPVKVKCITPDEDVQYEVDLRCSPRTGLVENGKEVLMPNPRDYKKIDTESAIGRRLLRSLRENPYHEWTEVAWDYATEEGMTRVVALAQVAGDHLAWVYVDPTAVGTHKVRTKVIFPQTQEIKHKAENGGLFTVGYTIRYSDYDELPSQMAGLVKRELRAIINRLSNSGFVVKTKSPHDSFGCVILTLVRKDLDTPRKRFLARFD